MKKLLSFLLSSFSLCSIVFGYKLHLTEVFVDGTDEFVEISNMSSEPFVGNLLLSGAKSTILSFTDITIPARSSFVGGDTLAMVSSFNGFQYKTGLSLNFADTVGLNVSLWQGTILLDNFVVSSGDVVANDNKKTSFHKYFAGNISGIVVSSSSLSSGVIAGFVAHPGLVYDSNGALLIPYDNTTGPNSSTGSSSGTSLTIDCASVLSGILHIDEIYAGSQYPDYIELLIDRDWTGGLVLSGSSLSIPLILPSQSWIQGQRYLIANNSSGFHHSNNIILMSGLKLSTGIIKVSSLSHQNLTFTLIDTTGQSLYHTTNYNCVDDLATPGNPSPGFDKVFLSYLNTTTVTTTITITGACVTTGSSSSFTGNDTTSGTTYSASGVSVGDVKISLIDYDPLGSDTNNERIAFLSLSGDVALSGLLLSYDGKFYKFSSGVVSSGQEIILTGNYLFVNSRTVCVALYQGTILLDTACYDPNKNPSPFYPLQSRDTDRQELTGVVSEDIDYASLHFDIRSVIYDPPGSDTNAESVTIYFSGGISGLLLDDFRLRVGTSNKRIYGFIGVGETKTLVGNFQMSNTNPTCIALTYNEIVYDEYCYNPSVYSPPSELSKSVNIESDLYSSRLIAITNVVYDPDGSDRDRETLTLLMTGNQEVVDLSKLYIRFGSTKRPLRGRLDNSTQLILTGDFQMPNGKATCVDLMEGKHVFDTYCYDPTTEKIEDREKPEKKEGTGEVNKTKKKNSDPVIDWLEYYSGLQLQRILPNPKNKDIKNDNEKFALYWDIGTGTTRLLNKQVRLVVGKTIIYLSGTVFDANDVVITSPKSLVNKAACARLWVGEIEIDKICYPQTKEGQIYYNERFDSKSFALPNSVVDGLDADGIDLSQLSLKKSGTKVCLVYDTVQIRCMAGGGTKTSGIAKKTTTLGNAYIRQITSLIKSKSLQYDTVDAWTDSYRDLASLIKQGKTTITIRDHTIATTDLETYKILVYERKTSDIVIDALVYNLFDTAL